MRRREREEGREGRRKQESDREREEKREGGRDRGINVGVKKI